MILIATHYWSNECEVTGKSSCYEEESIFQLEHANVGTSVFPNSNTEWLHGNVKLQEIYPEEIILGTGTETFIIHRNEVYKTAIYTKDGNHQWWYTFQIKDL